MGDVVRKLTNQDIEQLMNQINFSASNLLNGTKAGTKYHDTVISICNSGGVTFQGKRVEHITCQFCTTDSGTNSKSSKADGFHNIIYDDYNCIGSDEAGSGDYFSPLTACAVYVSKEHIDILKTLGVDDLKKLTDAKIIELAE